MIDTLYVNGDSWTAGDELHLDPEFKKWMENNGWKMQDTPDVFNHTIENVDGRVASARQYFNQFNWAGSVANELNIKNIVNDSMGGGSNPRIVRTTCEFLRKFTKSELDKVLVIIGWSVVNRNEICIDNPEPTWEMLNVHCKISENRARLGCPITSRELELDKFHKIYVNAIQNDFASIHRYFLDQYLLAGLLSSLGVRFLFFNGLPAWWDHETTKRNNYPRVTFAKELAYQESHNNMLSINDTFYTFCRSRNLKCGPGHHPFSDAHRMWGEYLISELKDRNIIQ
jgi:hypothetical protein